MPNRDIKLSSYDSSPELSAEKYAEYGVKLFDMIRDKINLLNSNVSLLTHLKKAAMYCEVFIAAKLLSPMDAFFELAKELKRVDFQAEKEKKKWLSPSKEFKDDHFLMKVKEMVTAIENNTLLPPPRKQNKLTGS